MKLKTILLEQEHKKMSNTQFMLETSANFWSELVRVQGLPLSESARETEENKLTQILVEAAFQLPFDQHDQFKKIFQMGIDQDGLKQFNESIQLNEGQQLNEVFDKIKDLWKSLKNFAGKVSDSLKKLGKKIMEKVLNGLRAIKGFVEPIIQRVSEALRNLDATLKPQMNESIFNESYDEFFNKLESDLDYMSEHQQLIFEGLEDDIIDPYVEKITAEFQTSPLEVLVAKVVAKTKTSYDVPGSVNGSVLVRIIRKIVEKTGSTAIDFNGDDAADIRAARIFTKEKGLRKLIKAEVKELTGDAGDVDADNEFDALHDPDMAERVTERMFRDPDYISACKKLELDYTEPENAFKVALKKQKWAILLGMVSIGLSAFTNLGLLSVTQLLASTLIPLGLEFLAAYGEQKNWDIKTVDRLRFIAKWSKRLGMVISIRNIAVAGWNFFTESAGTVANEASKVIFQPDHIAAISKSTGIGADVLQHMKPENVEVVKSFIGDGTKALTPDQIFNMKVGILGNNADLAGHLGLGADQLAKAQGLIGGVSGVTDAAASAVKTKLDAISSFHNATPEAQKALQAGIESKYYTADAFAAMKPENQAKFLADIADGKMSTASYDMIKAAGGAHAQTVVDATQQATDATQQATDATKAGADAANHVANATNTLNQVQIANIGAETGLSPDAIKALGPENAKLIQDAVNKPGMMNADDLIKLKADMLKTHAGLSDKSLGVLDTAIEKAKNLAAIKDMPVADYMMAKDASGDSIMSIMQDRGVTDPDVVQSIATKSKELGISTDKFFNIIGNSNLHDGALAKLDQAGQLKTYFELGNKFGENSEVMAAITAKAGTGAMENMNHLATTLADKPDILAKAISNSNMTSDAMSKLSTTQLDSYAQAFSKVAGNDDAVKHITSLLADSKLSAFTDSIANHKIAPDLANKIYSMSADNLAKVSNGNVDQFVALAQKATGVDDLSKLSSLSSTAIEHFSSNLPGADKVFHMLGNNTMTSDQINTIMQQGTADKFMSVINKGVDLKADGISKLVDLNSTSFDKITALNPREVTELIKNNPVDKLNDIGKLTELVTAQQGITTGLDAAKTAFTTVWSDPANAGQIALLKSKGFDEETIKKTFDYLGRSLGDQAGQVNYDQVLKAISMKADTGFLSSSPKDIIDAVVVKNGEIASEFVKAAPTPAA